MLGLIIGFCWSCQAVSQARIFNQCDFPVYVRSVLGDSPAVGVVNPGDSYVEDYRYLSAFNPAYGHNTTVGVSMKIVHDATVDHAMSDQERIAAFDGASTVTQLEYTYDPSLTPDLYYDISDINDERPRQFCQWGLELLPDSPECATVSCPSNCGQDCPAVYNAWNDDHATHGCSSSVGITLLLCT